MTEMEHLQEKEDMLTWLNGRATTIQVHHGGELVHLWAPEDEISIEDAILQFCKKHGIDMAKEINP